MFSEQYSDRLLLNLENLTIECRQNRSASRLSSQQRDFAKAIAGSQASDRLRSPVPLDMDFGFACGKDEHRVARRPLGNDLFALPETNPSGTMRKLI